MKEGVLRNFELQKVNLDLDHIPHNKTKFLNT